MPQENDEQRVRLSGIARHDDALGIFGESRGQDLRSNPHHNHRACHTDFPDQRSPALLQNQTRAVRRVFP
jgi:hypothetical protein